MRVKAVVFDVGETIVNECRLWRAWAEWLKVPEHTFLSTLGVMIERGEHHRRVFETFQPDFDFHAAREQRRFTDNPDQLKPADLYPGAAPCLNELRRRGLRIGITGNQPADIEEVLNGIGLTIDFVAPPRARSRDDCGIPPERPVGLHTRQASRGPEGTHPRGESRRLPAALDSYDKK